MVKREGAGEGVLGGVRGNGEGGDGLGWIGVCEGERGGVGWGRVEEEKESSREG